MTLSGTHTNTKKNSKCLQTSTWKNTTEYGNLNIHTPTKTISF